MGRLRLRRTVQSLRLRVPAIAMLVFMVSLGIASLLAYELLLRDGQADIDTVLAREQERFERSMGELLTEVRQDAPDAEPVDALRTAVRRYLSLNPSTDSYWTIVTFADGTRLAASNGPPELEPLYREDRLPAGRVNVRETIPTEAGDVRTSSVPVQLDGQDIATLQIVAPLGPERDEAFEAARLVGAAASIALVLGGILLAASLWRSLTRLGQLAAAARSTELRSLDARVDEPSTTDEVGILAREFNTMLDRLEQASVAQREFMASIGHELRTPITIARGHLEMLETFGPDNGTALRDTVTVLRDELGRMGRLVEDLMAIARSDMEDFVRPRELELVQWFEDLELRLTGAPNSRHVRIEPPPPIMIRVDPDRLSQAVLNLVTNASIHTPQGTEVRVSAEVLDDEVAIAVSDDGPGIPEEIRDEVFRPFVRAGEAPNSTGLGLSVVAAVAEAHGGRVDLTTSAEGTRIELRLPWTPHGDEPAIIGPGAPVDLHETPPGHQEQPTTPAERPSLRGQRTS